MSDILNIDSLLAEQQNAVAKVDMTNEQEAGNLASAMAKKIFNILKDEFITSSIESKKDALIKVITAVDTDIVIEDKHKNEWCAKSIIKNLKESLESEWYEVTIKAKVADILLYKSVPLEVAIPEEKLQALWLQKKTKRIESAKLWDTAKVIQLHTNRKSEWQDVKVWNSWFH